MNTLFEKLADSSHWRIYGGFVPQENIIDISNNSVTCKTDYYTIDAKCDVDKFGVNHYTGTLTNTTNESITINGINAVFNIGSGEFEVYTQQNTWQNESVGAWQPLNSGVIAEGAWSRISSNNAPILAIWNEQTSRGIVFHLLPDYAWQMKAHYEWVGAEVTTCVVEISAHPNNLHMTLGAGESLPTPNVIFYEFTNKRDLDAYKLHNYINTTVEKKRLPITYNTWMSNFDKVTFDNVLEQIKPASELGVEYFVIDAGWFGRGSEWWTTRGDWTENQTGAFFGRMDELANAVRENGMRFGLWFEIESASDQSDIVKNHPEYFISRGELRFLDFTKAEAREFILGELIRNIDKYGIEYIKFDYNQDLHVDAMGKAFYDYLAGYDMVISEIKKRYPNLYCENCASGGQRVSLKYCGMFDGFWPSDDESPFDQLDIFAETLKRLPPNYFDRWVTIKSLPDFGPVVCDDWKQDKILACVDAEWKYASEVKASFLTGFLTGGPIGLSFDLTKLTQGHLSMLQAHIAKIKSEREFWDSCVCRLLAHTGMVDVFEFSDMSLQNIKIVAFMKKSRQKSVYVYPVVDINATYILNGEERTGSDITDNGIYVEFDGRFTSKSIELIVK